MMMDDDENDGDGDDDLLLSGFYLLINRFLCPSQFFFLQIFNKKVEVVSESKVYISSLPCILLLCTKTIV